MVKSTHEAVSESRFELKDIVGLAKRRGFVFPASDIYGGINGFWDYGPLGIDLKNNIRDLWWKRMVVTPPLGPDGLPIAIVGLDSAIIQNPKTWIASGHVGGFSDPMVDCRETKLRYRQDHLLVLIPKDGVGVWVAIQDGMSSSDAEKRLKKLNQAKGLDCYDIIALTELAAADYVNVVAPDAKSAGTLTEPKLFNLMFETSVGAAVGFDSKAFLRPETAQGIFLNYKNILDSSRVKLPFGVAQIGKAFRNEVNPRNFIFRSREFEQMELEWFCSPADAEMWQKYWIAERFNFWLSVGINEQSLNLRRHEAQELAHYAKSGAGTVDIEYRFPFTSPGFGELEGVAHRCDFDLTQHAKHSGSKMEYIDTELGTRYIPHVIEPAAGLTRAVLAVLCESFTPDANRPSGMYLNLSPVLAPRKAAILPLTGKNGQAEMSQRLYMDLREEFRIEIDLKQNIGKRYARQDEIGTPFCFTIDDDSERDSSVTVRYRNTMAQERINIFRVSDFLRDKLK